jgi:hypothetical protein
MRPFTAVFCACVLLLLATGSWEAVAQGGLTPQEQLWVDGTRPVVEQAKRGGLPVDIVVQPQPAPGTAPLALAFLGGRCKLVFSMRENPLVQEQEERIEQDLGAGKASLYAALEFMAAHELFGHCARHVAGLWHAVPDGYLETLPDGLNQALQADFSEMRATRREEGYADLAALAWARANRYPIYARLHAWLAAERSHDLIEGGHHDTLAWLRSAGSGQAAIAEVWRDVLLAEASAAASDERSTTAERRSQDTRDTLRVSQR